MSFPSNELMFGGFLDEIDEYPVIIFKEPYLGHETLMFSAEWVLDHINEMYDAMSDNLKLMSIYMPHYTEDKSFMQHSIAKIIEVINNKAFNETMAKQKCKEGECTEEEMNADYERLRHIYDEEIHYQMNTRWNFTILLQERIQSIPEHYNKDQVKEIQKEYVHLVPAAIPLDFKTDLELWTKHKKDRYEENVLEDIMESIKNLGEELDSILSGDAEDHYEL